MATIQVQQQSQPIQEVRTTLSTEVGGGGEFVETRSVQLEWKVLNLKKLFDNTHGDQKSKCIKSSLFDSSRWQIYLYLNSGPEAYLSLYLSCEPTLQEREQGAESARSAVLGVKNESASSKNTGKKLGPWKREGKFKFSFEVRSLDGKSTFKQMEASDHVFEESQRNWGYQSFIKRNDIWYNNPSVRLADGMQIVCTIISSATAPSVSPIPRLLIPKDLVASFSSLFDDPEYSDVCFIIRSENVDDDADGGGGGGGRRKKKSEKRIYAAKKILAGRSEYFATMFNSGFYESTVVTPSIPTTLSSTNTQPRAPSPVHTDSDSDDTDEDFDEDDDSELDEDEEEIDKEVYFEGEIQSIPASFGRQVPSSAGASDEEERDRTINEEEEEESDLDGDTPILERGDNTSPSLEGGNLAATETLIAADKKESESFVDAVGDFTHRRINKRKAKKALVKGKVRDTRPRSEVVVTDASYTTFRALLYYLYTDSITFAPLSSTYIVAKENAQATNSPFPYSNRRSYLQANSVSTGLLPRSCSSKAIYRLGDKLGLSELKERACEHIMRNLTASNIVFEAFGSFTLRFEEIKRPQIAFLLERWNEVRSSPGMRRVFDQLRTGNLNHPGFEEVFLTIISSLEYKPDV